MTPPRWDVQRLAGIGTSVRLRDADGRAVSVVARIDGRCDVYPPGGEAFTLDPTTAVALGAVLAGHPDVSPGVRDRLAGVLGGLQVDSVTVERGSPAVGRSLVDLAVRARTGATVVAILRGHLPVVSPGPTERLAAGDELVVIGRDRDVDLVQELVEAADDGP